MSGRAALDGVLQSIGRGMGESAVQLAEKAFVLVLISKLGQEGLRRKNTGRDKGEKRKPTMASRCFESGTYGPALLKV